MKLPNNLYVSGPMTGMPGFNFPAFFEASDSLKEAGFETTNPAELNPEHGHPWIYYMRRDIAAMTERCDGVATLPGWQRSKGARLEVYIATELGLPVRPVWAWLLLARLGNIASLGWRMSRVGR